MGLEVWGLGGLGSRDYGFGCRVSGFGFRVLGFGFRVSGFGFRVSGFGFRVSGFGFRVKTGGGSRMHREPRRSAPEPTRALDHPLFLTTHPYIAHCMGACSAKGEWSLFSLALSPLYLASLHRAPHSTYRRRKSHAPRASSKRPSARNSCATPGFRVSGWGVSVCHLWPRLPPLAPVVVRSTSTVSYGRGTPALLQRTVRLLWRVRSMRRLLQGWPSSSSLLLSA